MMGAPKKNESRYEEVYFVSIYYIMHVFKY